VSTNFTGPNEKKTAWRIQSAKKCQGKTDFRSKRSHDASRQKNTNLQQNADGLSGFSDGVWGKNPTRTLEKKGKKAKGKKKVKKTQTLKQRGPARELPEKKKKSWGGTRKLRRTRNPGVIENFKIRMPKRGGRDWGGDTN